MLRNWCLFTLAFMVVYIHAAPSFTNYGITPSNTLHCEAFKAHTSVYTDIALDEIYIAIAAPEFDNINHLGYVEVDSYFPNDIAGKPKIYGEGSSVYAKNGSKINLDYAMAEIYDLNVPAGSNFTFSLNFFPRKIIGNFELEFKIIYKPQGTDQYYCIPSSGTIDQQGWTINKKTCKITNQAPVINDYYIEFLSRNEVKISIDASDSDPNPLDYRFYYDNVWHSTSSDYIKLKDLEPGDYTVKFNVYDLVEYSNEEQVSFTVDPENSVPVFNLISAKSCNEGEALTFNVSAVDSDGDALTYSATGLPSGAQFSNQKFSWTPLYNQAGVYKAIFNVDDNNGGVASITVDINVNDISEKVVLKNDFSANPTLVPGSRYEIKWDAIGDFDKFVISYADAGNTDIKTIAEIENGTVRSYEWIIPDVTLTERYLQIEGYSSSQDVIAINAYDFFNIIHQEKLIVLIHGMEFSKLDDSTVTFHALGDNNSWGGNGEGYFNLKNLLETELKRPVVYFSYSHHEMSEPLINITSDLNDSLKKWSERFSIKELGVTLIAQSMGCLISTSLIANNDKFEMAKYIRDYIAIGGPNFGTPWAYLVDCSEYTKSMQYGSNYLISLNDAMPQFGSGIRVLSITGVTDNPLNLKWSNYSDVVVSISSANLENMGGANVYVPYSHCPILNVYGGVNGAIADIRSNQHKSYIAIKDFLNGNDNPESNKELVKSINVGNLYLRFVDEFGERIPYHNVSGTTIGCNNFTTYGREEGVYVAVDLPEGNHSINVITDEYFTSLVGVPVEVKRNVTNFVDIPVKKANLFEMAEFLIGEYICEFKGLKTIIFNHAKEAGTIIVSNGICSAIQENRKDQDTLWHIRNSLPDSTFTMDISIPFSSTNNKAKVYRLDSTWVIVDDNPIVANGKVTFQSMVSGVYKVETDDAVNMGVNNLPLEFGYGISQSRNGLFLKLALPSASNIDAAIYSMNGKVLSQIKQRKDAGYCTINLNSDKIATGIFVVAIKTKYGRINKTISLIK